MTEANVVRFRDAAASIDAKEIAARASIERRRGKAYTDDEWEEAKRNLLAYFRLLAEAECR